MPEPLKYKTLAAPVTAEFRDRGSKFLAYGYAVSSPEDIKGKIQHLKKEHPKANHHCLAWRLGHDGNLFRASDDGEPAGSAGRPILGQIDSAGLTNVLVVVVRYFGGTLLGVPGLINAYKTVTAAALEGAPLLDRWVEDRYVIEFDYPVMGEVLHLLKGHEATVYNQDLQLFCSVKAGIPGHLAPACLQKLSEIRGVTAKADTPA
jgi:uncharacterized YigZ family protein